MNVYGRSMMSEAKRAANSNVVRMALRPAEIDVKQKRAKRLLDVFDVIPRSPSSGERNRS
jgi:hypothetical protein